MKLREFNEEDVLIALAYKNLGFHVIGRDVYGCYAANVRDATRITGEHFVSIEEGESFDINYIISHKEINHIYGRAVF